MPSVAFFDLDRTLIRVNSGKLWFKRQRAEGRIRLHQALEAGAWLGLYELGLLEAEGALERAVRGLKGESEADIDARTKIFFEEDLADTFAPGGLAAVRRHQELGDTTVLLTSSSIYLGRCVQELLGLDDILCMRMQVVDGRFTGAIEQLCFGAHKVDVAKAWAEERGLALKDSWFYTDSFTDRAMLDSVKHPMVVAPDPRLARLAKRRSWPILDWNTASTGGPLERSA